MAELELAQVVVTARHFNPSIIDKHWLIKNQILGEDDFLDNCVFAPSVAHVHANAFDLLAIPDHIQFTPRNIDDSQAIIINGLAKIVQTLPHTPYLATGINFTWGVFIGSDQAVLTRKWFYCERQPFSREFDVPDAHFGAYFSKSVFDGGRLKLHVKPAIKHTGDNKENVVLLTFNFHFDLSADRASDELIEILQRWDEARLMAERISREMEESDGGGND